MARPHPAYGFACVPEEREFRNRVTVKQGVNTIETWVGRDIRKYIPGFYWLTLLSSALAQKHNVPLSVLQNVALEHVEIGVGQHLFRFYERPEDWRLVTAVAEHCSALPGVFDVEKVRPLFSSSRNILELNAMIRNWK